jgi:type II secretory pathway pseudopilin PulG
MQVASRTRVAFSIPELLVTMGVVFILLALAVGSVSHARHRSVVAATASNMRPMGLGLFSYAAENRDLPPVLGPPQWPPRTPYSINSGVVEPDGYWFAHSSMYAYLITAYLGDYGFAFVADSRNKHPEGTHAGQPVARGDFLLTHTLYAHPRFFDFDTREGPGQFGAQKLGDAAFPSSKGMLKLRGYHRHPRFGDVLACCAVPVESPVVWFDLSVSEHIVGRLKPGVFNPYERFFGAPGLDPRLFPGFPVQNTRFGLRGTDR